jgi:zinc protease
MLDRTLAPPFVKSSSFNLIKPHERHLPNGVDLFFVPGGTQEVLKIEMIFDAGRWFEHNPAAAYFTAHQLSKGTRSKSSFEIATIFDQYGAHLEINPGLDFVSVSIYALTKNLAPVLQLLVEIVSTPVFPDKELSQSKAVFIQNLKINNEKTSYVASQTFRKALFGEAHPYGIEVDEARVNTLDTTHLRKHLAAFFHAPKVFVSGKIDPENREIITDNLQQLHPGERPAPRAFPVDAKPVNRHIEKADSVQSSVRVGGRSLLRSHPDYIPLLFVSHILGGYFGSRLMKNIREEKGLTYGISASVHGLKNESYVVIGADVNKENVALTFEEIRRELKKLRTTTISGDELETTRNHFIGSLQAEITTPFAHAEKLKTITLFDLQQDHYQKMITRIENMTPARIAEISEQYLHEDSLFQIAVG